MKHFLMMMMLSIGWLVDFSIDQSMKTWLAVHRVFFQHFHFQKRKKIHKKVMNENERAKSTCKEKIIIFIPVKHHHHQILIQILIDSLIRYLIKNSSSTSNNNNINKIVNQYLNNNQKMIGSIVKLLILVNILALHYLMHNQNPM